MKLRIATILAAIVMVVAIIAVLHDWRRNLDVLGTVTPTASPKSVSAPTVLEPISNGGKAYGKPPSQANPTRATAPDVEKANLGHRFPATTHSKAALLPQVGVSGSVAPPTVRVRSSPVDPIAQNEDRRAAAIEADKVTLMLRDYRTRIGENPVGTNAEIMKAVMGGNSKGAMLGPPEGQHLNGDGELVDQWGTPYFFHQLSKSSMEIRSAGPDRKMYTEDDIVVR